MNDFDEFDELLCDFIREVRKAARAEVKEELEQMQNELDELREFRNRKEGIEREHALFLRKTEIEIAKAKEDAKKARLAELFAEFPLTAWKPSPNHVKPPKCDKCDEQRRIHFFSPRGKEYTEPCECSIGKTMFTPAPVELFEIRQNERDGNILVRYYTREDKNTVAVYEDHVYTKPMPKPWERREWYNRVFVNREDCEEYCNFLSEEDR